jgi:hypothetical protein
MGMSSHFADWGGHFPPGLNEAQPTRRVGAAGTEVPTDREAATEEDTPLQRPPTLIGWEHKNDCDPPRDTKRAAQQWTARIVLLRRILPHISRRRGVCAKTKRLERIDNTPCRLARNLGIFMRNL